MIRSASIFKRLPATMFSKLTLLGCFAFTCVFALEVSVQGRSPILQVGALTYAQTPEQISEYARVAYQIEQIRRRNYAQAKRILGGNVPEDVCTQPNIPNAVKGICDDFSQQAAKIIERSALTPAQFNDITRRRDRDPNLQRQIQQEIMRLQKAN